jgi:hypothetical protein
VAFSVQYPNILPFRFSSKEMLITVQQCWRETEARNLFIPKQFVKFLWVNSLFKPEEHKQKKAFCNYCFAITVLFALLLSHSASAIVMFCWLQLEYRGILFPNWPSSNFSLSQVVILSNLLGLRFCFTLHHPWGSDLLRLFDTSYFFYSRLLSGSQMNVFSVYDKRYDFNKALIQLPLTINGLSFSSRNSIVLKIHDMRIINV